METSLVSVIIVTYNSSRTITETLNSVQTQTYQNIELIVSDDSSTDNTIDVVNEWIECNSLRFVRCKLITSTVNTGVAPNINRGLRECNGEWVKILGGDDLFLPNAVEMVMNYATKDKDIIVSQYSTFVDNDGKKVMGEVHPLPTTKEFYYEEDPERRKEIINYVFIDATIGYFIRKKLLDTVGGFDEEYNMLEDVPMYYKLTQLGYRFYLLEKKCFLYRINESITHPLNKVYNTKYKDCSFRFHYKVVKKNVPWWKISYHQYWFMEYVKYKLIIKYANNCNNEITHIINLIFNNLTIDYQKRKLRNFIQNLFV